MKTYFPKQQDAAAVKKWRIIDAKGVILGKLATKVADALRGKDKAIFSSHVDTGDFVIVLNAKEIKVTGDKLKQKMYRYHTGYFGNMKEFTLQAMLDRNPTKVIEEAVAGMLPKNTSRRKVLSKLKVYAGSEHPHIAQQPQELKP